MRFRRALAVLLGVILPGFTQAQEFRALWADTFHAGLRNAAETSALIAGARAANCNAVVVEIRKRGDAYYRNGLEPIASDVAAVPAKDIASVATGSPGRVNTTTAHALTTGDLVQIAGNTGSVPSINGTHTVTVVDADTVRLNGVNITTAGTGGTITHLFDPLADLIRKAHTGTPRIEVHAWFVTYNIWNHQTNLPTQATHPYRVHPEWVSEDFAGAKWAGSSATSGNYQFDQGHPAVQQHTYDVVMDVLTRYDVDGIHFDYIRYSDHQSSANNQPWGYHPVAVARYLTQTAQDTPRAIASVTVGNPGRINTSGVHGLDTGDVVLIAGNSGSSPSINGTRTVTRVDADKVSLNGVNLTAAGTGGTIVLTRPAPSKPTWLQWRRDQVTALLRKTYLNAWALKPNVCVSAALIAYGTTAPTNEASFLNSESYRRTLQDWHAWMKEGILDLGCPMVYRNQSTTAGFAGWANFTRDHQYNRASAIGMGWYLNSISNTIAQVKLARQPDGTGKTSAGIVGYSYWVPNNVSSSGGPTQQNATWAALTDDAAAEIYDPGGTPVFATAVAPPSMPWKTNLTKGHLMGQIRDVATGHEFDGMTVTLSGPANRTLLTDATGFFGAVDLPVGTYTLTFTAHGHHPFSQTVQVTGASVAEPTLPVSRLPFQIISSTRGPTTLALTWHSIPGRSYRVEQSPDLRSWSPAQSGIPATAGASTTNYTWTIPAGWATQAFLRVVEQMP